METLDADGVLRRKCEEVAVRIAVSQLCYDPPERVERVLAVGRGFVGKQVARFELVAKAAYEEVDAVSGVGERVVVLHGGVFSPMGGAMLRR